MVFFKRIVRNTGKSAVLLVVLIALAGADDARAYTHDSSTAREIPRPAGENAGLRDDARDLSAKLHNYRWVGTSSGETSGQFAPLEHWKSMVMAGDSAGLRMLYSTNPPAQVSFGESSSTADADVDFWVGMKARDMKVDVVQTNSPQPDVRVILFQAEIQPASSTRSHGVFVNELQTWQQQGDQWRLVAVQRTGTASLKQPLSKNKDIYPANADAHAEIREAEERAAREHKRVLLVFGANWCYDCHVLDLAFQRPDFLPVVERYVAVHVDIGADGKKNGDIAKQFQVPLEKGIPALAVLESNGQLVVSQKHGEFENARAMTPDALLEFLNKWKAEAR